MSQQQHTQEPWRVAIGDDYHIEADGIPEKYPHHFGYSENRVEIE